MKIEIVEFYPDIISREKTKGTMHVYLADEHIDIRGVGVLGEKTKFRFRLPMYFRKDHETKKMTMYPTFNFTDPEKNKELNRQIRIEGKKYVRQYLKNLKEEENAKETTSEKPHIDKGAEPVS